jgi:anthranilate synthase/phosphoribosyltransferase
LRKKRVPITSSRPLLDIVGTGGDGMGTFNISSLAAVTAAACGAAVAKHGNRAVSSISGSADFFAGMGVPIDLSPAGAEQLLEETGFSFLFAPIYHSAMKYAAPARRELGVKTIMNLLGPLVNPACAEYQVIGVFSHEFLRPVAEAIQMLGVKRAMVVHASDGLDEITVTGPTEAYLVEENGSIDRMSIDPGSMGISAYKVNDLIGGSSEDNSASALELIEGRGSPALLDAVSLNAGAGLLVYGIVPTLSEGYAMAKDAFRSGTVKNKLRQIIETGAHL